MSRSLEKNSRGRKRVRDRLLLPWLFAIDLPTSNASGGLGDSTRGAGTHTIIEGPNEN